MSPELPLHLLFLLLLGCRARARLVTYTEDHQSALAAEQCVFEMYPRPHRVQLRDTDAACILYCVFRKFKIITSSGLINLDVYRKHVQLSQQLDQRALDYGHRCADAAENIKHKHDVCQKAQVFNDCTNLYRMRFH